MCQKWFAKFHSEEMNIEDAPRSGQPVTTNVDQITALIDFDRQINCFRTFKQAPDYKKA